MEINKRVEIAMDSRKRGYNCAQAVVCAFKDRYGDFTESQLMKVSESFGGGIAHTQSVCGAVTGMLILLGLENADGNTEKTQTKFETYDIGAGLMKKFEEMNQSVICRDLKGIDTKVMLRSCNGCIEDAIRIFGEYIGEK